MVDGESEKKFVMVEGDTFIIKGGDMRIINLPTGSILDGKPPFTCALLTLFLPSLTRTEPKMKQRRLVILDSRHPSSTCGGFF